LKSRDAAKVIAATGWGTGMILILSGAWLLLALAVLAAGIALAVAAERKGAALLGPLKTRIARILTRQPKMPQTTERKALERV
jgi:hypothetical protein